MTGRLPFDPKRMAQSQLAAKEAALAAAPASAPKTAPKTTTKTTPDASEGAMRVSQLAQRIATVLETGLPASVRVVGEISGARERTHWYFDLKDEESVVSCALFRSAAKRVKTLPSDGARVVVSGRVEFYAKAGKVTFIVEAIEPVGRGSWEAQLRELVEAARREGWLDEERKRTLPSFPRAVAVVTSRSAAALQDVLVTMARRCPAVDVVVIDSRVQGKEAVADVVAAMARAGELARAGRVDAVIVTRGGGSVEDLWCFNDLAIARAIVQCPVPVVAAIGHETDTTIAELVADERCATPTQAAMRLTPDREALSREVGSVQRRLEMAMQRDLERAEQRLRVCMRSEPVRRPELALAAYARVLEACLARAQRAGASLARVPERRVQLLMRRMAAQQPRERLLRESARARDMQARMQTALRTQLRGLHAQVDARQRQLQAISPVSVLARGYSVTTLADGTIVRSPAQAPLGTTLHTRVATGDISSVVSGAATQPWKPRRSPRKSPPHESGPGLFGA
jgi:exodeoxyribonuclease VII large subunit